MAGSMERWVGKAAIVTGASSGIGYAIAENLVNEGVKVVAVGRRKENLLKLQEKCQNKKGQLHYYCADITKEDDILNMFKWASENVGPIHILVNSAGVVRLTTLTEGETQLWKDILDTNVLGLCIATREAVKNMRANNVDGHIIHINSCAGHKVFTIPEFNVYSASKFAVTALTETLRSELNSMGDKIKISSVSPGGVRTEFMESSFAASKTAIDTKFTASINEIPTLNPEDVAEAVKFVLSTPPHVQIHELMMRPMGQEF